MAIKLGSVVTDTTTGYTGVVTARAEYLHESPRVLVEAIDTTKRPIEWWIVETRAEVISDGD